MEVIKFTKILDYTVLCEALKLRTSLKSVLNKIDYSFPSGFSEDEELTDNLVFHFSSALNSEQKDELASLVNDIDENYDLVVRSNIKNKKVKDKVAFGREFINIVSANNEYMGKDTLKIAALLESYPSLIICCLTGSIDLLHSLIMSMQPDENISIEELNEYKKRVELFIEMQQ
jgi:hypothetical protein